MSVTLLAPTTSGVEERVLSFVTELVSQASGWLKPARF